MLVRYDFRSLHWILWLILYKRLKVGSTLEANNGLLGTPEIQCNPATIELAFKTKRVFRGKVFVKGHYNNPDCRVDYGKASTDNKNAISSIRLSHGQCNMDRQRTLFITKLDRAFHIKCLYREAARMVSSNIEVSAMATQALEYEYPMPTCIYTIRRDEIDGPILKYARVGEQIVHRWECQSDIYGLLVHTCYVEDGQGEKQMIIDENGCHMDRTLLGDPTYVESLNMAYRESIVFKFADRIIVRFQCQIRLCIREDGGCVGVTPPMCLDDEKQRMRGLAEEPIVHYALESSKTYNHVEKRRLMRSALAERLKPTFDTDLISQPVYVLDADDEDTDGVRSDHLKDDNDRLRICVSNEIFVCIVCMSVAAVLAITASAARFIFWWIRFAFGTTCAILLLNFLCTIIGKSKPF